MAQAMRSEASTILHCKVHILGQKPEQTQFTLLVILFRKMSKKNYHTGIRIIGYDLIVQRLLEPKEVRVSITSDSKEKVPNDNDIDVIVSYLGDEGFFDYYDGSDESGRVQIGFLNPKRFRNLERMINQ